MFLMLNPLFLGPGTVSCCEPVDFNSLAQGLQLVFVDLHLTDGTTAIVEALDDQDRGTDLFRIGDR